MTGPRESRNGRRRAPLNNQWRTQAVTSFAKALVGSLALIALFVFAGQGTSAAAAGVKSLRGDTAMEAMPAPMAFQKLNTRSSTFARSFRQVPPMVPHKMTYAINLKKNECINCHDWPNSVKEDAPKISESHYKDRNGVALERVSGARYFCTQCHAAQSKGDVLVGNSFTPSGR